MKYLGVSLAAGLATRLRPLTDYYPKAELPVLGVPSLYYAFAQFQRLGLEGWAVNSHHLHEYVKLLLDHWPGDGEIHLSFEREILGSGGCYPELEAWRGGANLITYNPDILSDIDLGLVVKQFESSDSSALIAYTTNPPPGSNATVHIDESGKVVGLGGEPPEGTSHSVYGAGIFVLSDDLLKTIPKGPSSLTEHLRHALNRGESIDTYCHDGLWFDLGDSLPRYFQSQLYAIEALIKHPACSLSETIRFLWALLGKEVDEVPLYDGRFVDNMVDVDAKADVGANCVISGPVSLGQDFVGENLLLFGRDQQTFAGSLNQHIVTPEVSVDLG